MDPEETALAKKPRRAADCNPSSSSSSSSSAAEIDLISRLPDCLLSTIYPHLTTREAAKTALLSSRWRRLWTTSPLHLDDDSLWSRSIQPRGRPRGSRMWTRDEDWRCRVISRILRSHAGPVRLFRLAHTRFHGREPLAHSWFQTLAQKCVLQIDLLFPSLYDAQDVPASLLACDSLQTLRLSHCRLPDTAKTPVDITLTRLTELTLSGARLTEHDFCGLLSGCTALRSLSVIYNNSYLPRIHVRSRSLRSLTLSGSGAEELFIEDAPNLARLLMGWVSSKMWLKVVSAPKLEMLGYLHLLVQRLELGKSVFRVFLPFFLARYCFQQLPLFCSLRKSLFFASSDVAAYSGYKLEHSAVYS